MSGLARRGLGSLLALGLCLLSLACDGPGAPTPLPPLAGPEPGPNLLRNAHFFQDAAAWEPKGAMALGYDQAGFLTLAVGNAPAPQSAGWSQAVAVQPGATYDLSYRAHTERLAGYADLRVSFYDAAGRLLWRTGCLPVSGDTSWATHARRLRAPEGAVQATVTLGVEGAVTGRAAFDDAYLAPDEAPPARALIVDYAHEIGPLRSLQQLSQATLSQPVATLLGVDRVRVSCDLDAIFPNPYADPDDPLAYDLTACDSNLARVAGGAAEVFFQLRQSGPPRLAPDRWAAVARHVVMHCNEGWAAGHTYGIRYWELGGEHFLPAPQGRPEDSYALFAAAVSALQAHDPGLRVGGPGLSSGADLPYLEGLLAYLAERGVRPGFISYHCYYDGSPRAGAAVEQRLEQLLDRYGLGDVEPIASEWGLPGSDGQSPGDAYAAAHLVASAAYWQDTRLAAAFRSWPGDTTDLVTAQGELTAAGQAYRLLGQLQSTPRRLATQGGDALGFALLAAKSEDGRRVQVVIADVGSGSAEYRLALANFPPGFRYLITEVSNEHRAEVVARGEQAGLTDGVVVLPWHSPEVQFIELWWAE